MLQELVVCGPGCFILFWFQTQGSGRVLALGNVGAGWLRKGAQLWHLVWLRDAAQIHLLNVCWLLNVPDLHRGGSDVAQWQALAAYVAMHCAASPLYANKVPGKLLHKAQFALHFASDLGWGGSGLGSQLV